MTIEDGFRQHTEESATTPAKKVLTLVACGGLLVLCVLALIVVEMVKQSVGFSSGGGTSLYDLVISNTATHLLSVLG